VEQILGREHRGFGHAVDNRGKRREHSCDSVRSNAVWLLQASSGSEALPTDFAELLAQMMAFD
jgi:hypothetical protein